MAEPAPSPVDAELFARVERLRILVESGMAGSAQHQDAPDLLAGEILDLADRTIVELANPDDVVHSLFPLDQPGPQARQ